MTTDFQNLPSGDLSPEDQKEIIEAYVLEFYKACARNQFDPATFIDAICGSAIGVSCRSLNRPGLIDLAEKLHAIARAIEETATARVN